MCVIIYVGIAESPLFREKVSYLHIYLAYIILSVYYTTMHITRNTTTYITLLYYTLILCIICYACIQRPWFRKYFPVFMKYITGGYVGEEEAGQRLGQGQNYDLRMHTSIVYIIYMTLLPMYYISYNSFTLTLSYIYSDRRSSLCPLWRILELERWPPSR